MPGTPLVGFSLATRHAAFAQGEGLPGKVWQNGIALWVPDVGVDPGQLRSSQAAREDIHAALALPVTVRGEVTGVMEFFSSRVREPDEELMALLTGIGSLVGQFIRHRDAERDVRASEARKSAIVNAAFECIIGLDAHGSVTEFNPAAELTFARPRDEAMGLSITDLLVVDRLDEAHRADIDALLAGQLPRLLGLPTEAIGRRSDGREFPAELAITQIDLPGPPSFTVYLRDITASRAAAGGDAPPGRDRRDHQRRDPVQDAGRHHPHLEPRRGAALRLHGRGGGGAGGRDAVHRGGRRRDRRRAVPRWGGASGSSSSRPCTSARTDRPWTCR